MGMYLGGEEKKDRERKKSEKKTAVLPSNAETAKQALKAIILFARMAMGKGQEENQLSLWQPITYTSSIP